MIVQELPWDSEFFGFAVGSLAIPSISPPDDVLEIVNSCDFDVVYIQIENPTVDQLEGFSKLAPLIDHKIVYEKMISDEGSYPKSRMERYEGDVTDDLVELAWASGLHSRFNLDPKFNAHFQRLYRTWIEKSIEGELADATFVSLVKDNQVGFVTVAAKNAIGQIGLIAVSSDHRRQGIAGCLLENAETWSVRAGLQRIRVSTQQRNAAAARLCEKQGYRIENTMGIYHYWKPGRK